MTSATDTTRPRRGILLRLRRFRRDENGATAVEFGIVALPFFALMWATLETALAFFAGQALETAVSNSARLIRTGQAQQQAFDKDAFKDEICDQLWRLMTCDNLHLDVRTFPSYGAISVTTPYDEDNNLDPEDFDYVPGESSEIVLVRAFYDWPVYVNQLGNDLTNTGNGKHLLAAAAAFRNEPFPW